MVDPSSADTAQPRPWWCRLWLGEQPLWLTFLALGIGGWVGFVALAYAVWQLVSYLPGLDEGVAYALLAIGVLFFLWTCIALWRSASRAAGWARHVSRCAVVLYPLVVALVVLFFPDGHHSSPRYMLLEGASLSVPARTAVGIACAENSLRPGMSHSDLGLLEGPERPDGKVKSVHIDVVSRSKARVTITFRTFGAPSGLFGDGREVREDDTLVYVGTCSADGMRFAVSGTVDERFWPRH